MRVPHVTPELLIVLMNKGTFSDTYGYRNCNRSPLYLFPSVSVNSSAAFGNEPSVHLPLKRWVQPLVLNCSYITAEHVQAPITVAGRAKAWTVFARSNTGIVGSNPTQGMDVCLCLFCVCVVLYVVSGLATGWSLVQGVVPAVCRIKKLKSG
jgi:hypothetical protein